MEYRWQPIGGHVALDLCNTVSWRRDPARTNDRLAGPEHLTDWWNTVALPALSTSPTRGGGVQVLIGDDAGLGGTRPGAGAPVGRGASGEAAGARGSGGGAPGGSGAPVGRGAAGGFGAAVGRGVGELEGVRGLREVVRQVVVGSLEGEVSASLIGVLNEARRSAEGNARVGRGLPMTWEVDGDAPDVMTTALALAVGDLLTDPAIARVKECSGDGCGWLFLDTSRNHSRRWCAGGDCGNRARVRAYVQRKKSSG